METQKPKNSSSRTHGLHCPKIGPHVTFYRADAKDAIPARKFTLPLLRIYEVKPPEKLHKRNLTFDAPCLQKNDQHTLESIQIPPDSQPFTLPMRHTYLTRILCLCVCVCVTICVGTLCYSFSFINQTDEEDGTEGLE